MLLLLGYVAIGWVYASVAMSGQIRRHEIPQLGAIAPQPVTLYSGDIALDAGFYPNPAGASCAVVMLHGIDDDRASVLAFAPLYWDRGCSVFAFDHRDHGRSSSAHRTYGFHEADDAVLAIDWVIDRTSLAPGHIGLHGISFGAATALEVLERRDDLAFVVADSPYSSMGSIVASSAANSLGVLEPLVRPWAHFLIERRADMAIDDVDPAAAIAGVATPILLIHTAGDDIVPEEHSATIGERNPAVERHVLEAGGIHLNAYSMRTAEYTSIVHEFMDRQAPQLAG